MAYYKCGSIHPTQNSNVVVDIASGAIANFQTPLAIPLPKIQFDFKATQEAGTPTPQSPKAISGVSEVSVFHSGVNLFDKSTIVNDVYISDSDGVAKANTGDKSTDYILVVPNCSYYIKSEQTAGRWGAWYDKDKNFIEGINFYNRIKTAPQNARYMRLTVVRSGNGNPDTFAVNYPASDTEYHAYNNASSTTIINLGGTYYGGYISQDKDGKRELVVTHGIKLFSDLDFRRSNNSGVWEGYRFYALVDKLRGKDVKCSHYEAFSVISASDVMNNETLIAQLGNDYIYVKDDNYTTVEAFKTANANTQLWYELAEPFTVALPDGEPIKSFAGVNNIFADTGDTSLQFAKIGN